MYKRLKKYIALLLCCSVFVTSTVHQQKEVKAIAPAIPIVVIGAIALGGGVYFANKDDLQSMASDCMDWLKDNVVDAYNDAVNLVANGGKYIVTGALTSGVYAYLKHKYGWGSTDTPVTSVSLPINMDKEVRGVLDSVMSMPNFKDYVGMSSWLSSTSNCLFTGYADEEADAYYVYAWSKGITDIYRDSAITSYVSIKAIVNGTEQPIKNICKIIGIGGITSQPTAYEFSMSDVIPPYDGMIVGGAVTYANARVAVSTNSNGFLSGVNVWAYDTDYKLGNKTKKGYLGVTGTPLENVDIGYNASLQTDTTAIPVQTIGDMTLEQFIEATGDLVNDDTPAWEQVLERLTGSSDNDNENKDPVGGDFIIPGLGIQWFTDLADKVGSIPQTIKDSISDLFLKYEDFKEWLATEIKSIPTAIKEVVSSIKDIPTNLSSYFDKVVDAISAIPVLDLTGVLNGILAIPGYIQALPGQFVDWFDRVISGIQAIPGEFTNWFDNIIDKLTELCEVVSNIFVVDTTQIDFATFADVAQGKFNIIKQLDYVVDEVRKIKPSNDIPVIYIKTPPQFKPFITDSEIIFVDLRPYKPFFDFCRVTLEAFVWFWVFRYLFKKFDLTITITP